MHLGIGNVGAVEVVAGVASRFAVIAKPGLEVVANAARQDQVVVIHHAMRGAHLALLAVKTVDLGLDQAIAVLVGGMRHVVMDKVGVDDVHQPLVAHRAGPEGGVAFQHHHIGLGYPLSQVACRGQAAPATATDDDARATAMARQQARFGVDDGGCRYGGQGQAGGRTQRQGRRRGHEGSAFHVKNEVKCKKRGRQGSWPEPDCKLVAPDDTGVSVWRTSAPGIYPFSSSLRAPDIVRDGAIPAFAIQRLLAAETRIGIQRTHAT